MNSNSFVSIDHIISEVTSILGDEEFRNGCSRGWYVSRIQDALQELSFDTFYQKLTVDFDFPTDNLRMDMPKNSFNIREMYGWNGACCSPQSSAIIWPKRLYNNKGGDGRGYTAKVKKTGETIGNDPFMPSYYNDGNFHNYPEAKYYYNVQNGEIMFSSNCAGFQKVRIVYNGIGVENIGDLPIIPTFFERAINDYVEERYWAKKKGENPRKYRILWADAQTKLTDYVNGNWAKALKRIKFMDTSEKEAYEEYLSSMYHR